MAWEDLTRTRSLTIDQGEARFRVTRDGYIELSLHGDDLHAIGVHLGDMIGVQFGSGIDAGFFRIGKAKVGWKVTATSGARQSARRITMGGQPGRRLQVAEARPPVFLGRAMRHGAHLIVDVPPWLQPIRGAP